MLGREIVPELLQERCDAANIENHIAALLSKGELYEKQQKGFEKVCRVLGMGERTPSENACEVILNQIEKYEK